MKSKGYLNGLLAGVICLLTLCSTPLIAGNGSGEKSADWDQVPPTAVCDDKLNVSLSSGGSAIVYAHSFDEGSYDNYCLQSIKVRRMDNHYATFGPYVVFDCDDIGELVSVELQAKDCAGNTNSCWSEVRVEDKLAPRIHCPYNRTVACDGLYNWPALGQATATDNCGVANISFTDTDNTGSCGTGYINRKWVATDIYGMTAHCIQRIHITDTSSIIVSFPPDTTITECVSAEVLEPENLPAPYNRPQVEGADCELLAFNHEDWVFTAAPNSCLKIIRQWKVIDWCSYQYGGSQGIWTGTQVLKIKDANPPTFTCPADITKSTSFGRCTANLTLPEPTDIEDCLPGVEISVFGDLGQGRVFSNVPIGEYEMNYVAEDGCGNRSSCKVNVSVVDGLPPGPVCIEGVSFPLMANGEAELWAVDVERGSSIDNCTPYNKLEFRLGREPAPGQATPPDEDFLRFTCADLGTNIIALWAGDEAGNWAYCLTTAVVQDHQEICPPGLAAASISGLVTDEHGHSLRQARVMIDSSEYESWTDTLGQYRFGDMPMGGSYTLRAEMQGDQRAGLSTADVIMLAKHLMGVDTLASPYQLIAADADRSGNLNNEDMMILHRLLLGMDTHFPDSVSWRFIPKHFEFPITHALSVNFPEHIVIDNLNSDMDRGDFIGVKLGDLDGSYIASQDTLQGRGLSAPLALVTPGRQLRPGELIEIPLIAKEFNAVFGMEAILRHPGLSLEEVVNDKLPGQVLWKKEKERSVLAWVSGRGHSVEEGYTALRLRFRVEKAGNLADVLYLEEKTKAFKGHQDLYEVPIVLEVGPAGGSLQLLNAFPNPFREQANIQFELPESSRVVLTVWNSQGQVVHQAEEWLGQGQQEFVLRAGELGSAGTYLFRLQAGLETATGRLALIAR